MALTNCKMAITDPLADTFDLPEDVGGVYFKGDFAHPWFFSSPRKIMMEDYSPRYIHIRTSKKAIFQFRLAVFHCKKSMLLTSTLGDTFWFFLPNPSIAGTMKRARAAQVPYASNTSFSGYVCWGQYFEDQHRKLRRHLKAHSLTLSDSSLKLIAQELLRREALYDEV